MSTSGDKQNIIVQAMDNEIERIADGFDRQGMISCGIAALACESCGFVSSIHTAPVYRSDIINSRLSDSENDDEVEFNLSMDELLSEDTPQAGEYTAQLCSEAYEQWVGEATAAGVSCPKLLSEGCKAYTYRIHAHLPTRMTFGGTDDDL